MQNKEFKKRKINPSILIEQYMKGEIFLTERQLDKCIELKRGTKQEGRGCVNFVYEELKTEKCNKTDMSKLASTKRKGRK